MLLLLLPLLLLLLLVLLLLSFVPVCVCVCVEETRGLAVKDHPPASPFLFCFSSYFFKTGAESRKQEKKEKNPTGPSTHLKNNIGDEQREHTQTHTPPPLPAQKKKANQIKKMKKNPTPLRPPDYSFISSFKDNDGSASFQHYPYNSIIIK